MSWKPSLCRLIAVLALSGCANSMPPSPPPIAPLPANLAMPCRPLAPVTEDNWDAVGRAYLDAVLALGECGARQAAR